MNLQPDECDQFYRIWWSLLSYANKQTKLLNDFPSQLESGSIKQQDAAIIRNALWASDRLLQDFIDDNPNNLSDADLKLAASWENRVAAKFFIMRHLQKYSLFLNDSGDPIVYGVIGIVSPISEILPFPPPIMVDAILLPFGDKIIFDSLLNSYPVRFGSGIRKNLNNQVRYAQESRGVITTLDGIDQIQGIINGNQKILIAFYKWLAKEGLSEKMQHEHHANVRVFVDDRLSSAIPPRSLLSVNAADLEAYFSACDNKANRVSFKRLVKFLCDSDRIGWEESKRMEKFLKLH
ncbi:MAG: hypothetical protein ACXW1W_18420 [Methylococcaceae bacterium]